MNVSLKKIPGYANYLAGGDGSIYALKPCGRTTKRHATPVKKKIHFYHDPAIPKVCVVSDKRTKRPMSVAYLVAMAFHGERPTLGARVCYNDGNSLNVAACNLSWSTPRLILEAGEVWRSIPDNHPFEASSLGRIRHPSPSGGWVEVKPTYYSTERYKTICLNGNRFRLHEVIALAFYGPRPDGMQVAHENGVPTDNRADNLSYKTPRENAADKLRHGTQPHGEMIPGVKISEADVVSIRMDDRRYSEIASSYRLSPSQICRIKNRHRWAHVA